MRSFRYSALLYAPLTRRKAGASDRDIHAMYKLVPEIHMRPKLDMVVTVQTFVEAHFEEEWQKIWVEMAQKGIRI